jgi:hypothetical protein
MKKKNVHKFSGVGMIALTIPLTRTIASSQSVNQKLEPK